MPSILNVINFHTKTEQEQRCRPDEQTLKLHWSCIVDYNKNRIMSTIFESPRQPSHFWVCFSGFSCAMNDQNSRRGSGAATKRSLSNDHANSSFQKMEFFLNFSPSLPRKFLKIALTLTASINLNPKNCAGSGSPRLLQHLKNKLQEKLN